MSSAIFKTVSVLGTEIEFIKAFVEEITKYNDITCDTDIDEQFASTENTPQIVLNVGDTGQIIMTRVSALSSTNTGYSMSAKIGNYTFSSSPNICYSAYTSTTSVTNRAWKFTVIDNDNAIFVAIYPHDADLSSSSVACLSYLLCKTTNFNLVVANTNKFSYNHINNIAFATDEETSRSFKVVNRMGAYNMPLGEIEIVKNKAFLSGTSKAFNFDGMYDCSNVNADTVIAVEGVNYYALDVCTLMKIEE